MTRNAYKRRVKFKDDAITTTTTTPNDPIELSPSEFIPITRTTTPSSTPSLNRNKILSGVIGKFPLHNGQNHQQIEQTSKVDEHVIETLKIQINEAMDAVEKRRREKAKKKDTWNCRFDSEMFQLQAVFSELNPINDVIDKFISHVNELESIGYKNRDPINQQALSMKIITKLSETSRHGFYLKEDVSLGIEHYIIATPFEYEMYLKRMEIVELNPHIVTKIMNQINSNKNQNNRSALNQWLKDQEEEEEHTAMITKADAMRKHLQIYILRNIVHLINSNNRPCIKNVGYNGLRRKLSSKLLSIVRFVLTLTSFLVEWNRNSKGRKMKNLKTTCDSKHFKSIHIDVVSPYYISWLHEIFTKFALSPYLRQSISHSFNDEWLYILELFSNQYPKENTLKQQWVNFKNQMRQSLQSPTLIPHNFDQGKRRSQRNLNKNPTYCFNQTNDNYFNSSEDEDQDEEQDEDDVYDVTIEKKRKPKSTTTKSKDIKRKSKKPPKGKTSKGKPKTPKKKTKSKKLNDQDIVDEQRNYWKSDNNKELFTKKNILELFTKNDNDKFPLLCSMMKYYISKDIIGLQSIVTVPQTQAKQIQKELEREGDNNNSQIMRNCIFYILGENPDCRNLSDLLFDSCLALPSKTQVYVGLVIPFKIYPEDDAMMKTQFVFYIFKFTKKEKRRRQRRSRNKINSKYQLWENWNLNYVESGDLFVTNNNRSSQSNPQKEEQEEYSGRINAQKRINFGVFMQNLWNEKHCDQGKENDHQLRKLNIVLYENYNYYMANNLMNHVTQVTNLQLKSKCDEDYKLEHLNQGCFVIDYMILSSRLIDFIQMMNKESKPNYEGQFKKICLNYGNDSKQQPWLDSKVHSETDKLFKAISSTVNKTDFDSQIIIDVVKEDQIPDKDKVHANYHDQAKNALFRHKALLFSNVQSYSSLFKEMDNNNNSNNKEMGNNNNHQNDADNNDDIVGNVTPDHEMDDNNNNSNNKEMGNNNNDQNDIEMKDKNNNNNNNNDQNADNNDIITWIMDDGSGTADVQQSENFMKKHFCNLYKHENEQNVYLDDVICEFDSLSMKMKKNENVSYGYKYIAETVNYINHHIEDCLSYCEDDDDSSTEEDDKQKTKETEEDDNNEKKDEKKCSICNALTGSDFNHVFNLSLINDIVDDPIKKEYKKFNAKRDKLFDINVHYDCMLKQEKCTNFVKMIFDRDWKLRYQLKYDRWSFVTSSNNLSIDENQHPLNNKEIHVRIPTEILNKQHGEKIAPNDDDNNNDILKFRILIKEDNHQVEDENEDNHQDEDENGKQDENEDQDGNGNQKTQAPESNQK